jgi:very-short-patch-repair endonuclease
MVDRRDREWQRSIDPRSKSATRRDERALLLASRQHQLLTASQLRSLGFSAGAVEHRLAAGRWFAVHSGVHSLSPPPLSDDARVMAAVLACGPGSVASDIACAWLFTLVPAAPTVIDVTNPRGAGRSRAGIRVHRRQLGPHDATTRRGIPCCTPTRLIADAAATLPVLQLEKMLLDASSRGWIDARRLHELASEPGRRGSRRLQAVLGIEIPKIRSSAEIAFLRICRSIDFEAPRVNEAIRVAGRRFEVDFHWPGLQLVVEIDGYAFHGARSRANADRDREQVLAMAGWFVHRFTRDQIVGARDEVAERLLRLLVTRQRSLAAIHR